MIGWESKNGAKLNSIKCSQTLMVAVLLVSDFVTKQKTHTHYAMWWGKASRIVHRQSPFDEANTLSRVVNNCFVCNTLAAGNVGIWIEGNCFDIMKSEMKYSLSKEIFFPSIDLCGLTKIILNQSWNECQNWNALINIIIIMNMWKEILMFGRDSDKLCDFRSRFAFEM